MIRNHLPGARLRGTELSQADSAASTDNGGAGTDLPVIDADVLSVLGANVGAELLPQITNTYLSECLARVDAVVAATASGDCALVAKEAHPLKSSSVNIGALRLAGLARSLEHAGRKQDLEKIERDISQLPGLSEQTREGLVYFQGSEHPASEDDLV